MFCLLFLIYEMISIINFHSIFEVIVYLLFYVVNKSVQFVTQVQDAKQTLDGTQPCAVYDVNPQQFYVNVDDTSELIEPGMY